ncbi:InlB B-repeat-containing protein [Faecalicatena contorta]|uniref:InlB B-repeat-containing protein n=1 Tax=Faecalicatena contorta TaxID=39482 RepID=UPI001F48ED4D|nr:InlB B-repeat-containing protein [Faecalicatena contorta]MCF2680650.1 InlB B-repeat-containing protein [Faecalicatena contorta]
MITGGRATSHDYNGMGVCVETGASFTMNGGTITDCSTDNLGGGVFNKGSFTMSGGSITGCSASSNGGGVFNEGSFTMNGGSITGCSASSAGGVFNKGSFTMNDGSITGCSADLGADVYNESSNSIVFCANGGEIRELYNSAPQLTIRKDNDTDGTIFSGDVTNYLSTIGAGIYRGAVTNAKKISHNFGGTISGGTFEGTVTNNNGATISGGTFMREVQNNGNISGGMFYGGISGSGKIGKTVTFMNGNAPYAMEVVSDNNLVVEPVEPTQDGYTFTGWYTDEALTDKYEFSNPPSGRITTLYAGFEPITYTVTYDGGEFGSQEEDVKTHGIPLTLRGKTYTREGYVQTGWKDGNGREYELGDSYTIDAELTLYPVWDEIIEVPFTTTVKQGGNVAPGKTVFNLQLVDYQGENLSSEDVKVTASITTDGAGSYEGIMTITGPSEYLPTMLSDGVFVKQVNEGEDGWTYDDRVWGLRYEGAIAFAYDDEIVPTSSILIFPAIFEESENGSYYKIPDDAYAVPQMSFTNTYTKSVAKTTDSNSKNDTTTNMQTGDNSNLALWFVLLAVSVVAVIFTGVYSRRRRSS